MGNQVFAKSIFKRNYFKSYSEFYLALAMGSVLYDRGYALNMDGMLVDASVLPDDMVKYYKKLLSIGAIQLSMYDGNGSPFTEYVKSDIDTSYFGKIKLLDDSTPYVLRWDMNFANENYGEYRKFFLDLLPLGNTLVHLVAYHLMNVYLDGEKRKLIISFDNQKARTTFLYVNIYSCLKTIPWIRDYVDLDIDFTGYHVDLDYSIHCNNGKVAGRYKLWSIREKLDLFKKYGMVEGAILVLWERQGMCENNVYGNIKASKIFRLDEIGDDFISVNFISINKTKEEVRLDYEAIDESVRHLYVDILDKKPYEISTELDICGVGVDNYFYDEDKFITLLDDSEEVYKLITIDGKQASVKMSGVDAIYWLLCQYGVEFDRELFKSMYFDGNSPMWDLYN